MSSSRQHQCQAAVQLWARLHAWHELAHQAVGEEKLAALGMANLEDEV
jgi:hypothetical protein